MQVPFNFIIMNKICIKDPSSSLLNVGYKFGEPLYIKNRPYIFNKNSSNRLDYYTNIINLNILPSYMLLLCVDANSSSIQNIVISSTIYKNLNHNDIKVLEKPLYKFNMYDIWKPIIYDYEIIIPKNNRIYFYNLAARNSYYNLLGLCDKHKIVLKINKGDLLIIDNRSILLGYDTKYKKYSCMYLR
jgi:hypothetical protein